MPTIRGTGWKAREDAARARMAQGIPAELAANLRIAGERDQQERETVAALVVEQERLRRETLCGCPACKGTGELTEAEAALVANAIVYFRAKNLAVDPVFFDKGRMLPRLDRADTPVMPAAEEAAALAELEPVKPSKSTRRAIVPPPFLEG